MSKSQVLIAEGNDFIQEWHDYEIKEFVENIDKYIAEDARYDLSVQWYNILREHLSVVRIDDDYCPRNAIEVLDNCIIGIDLEQKAWGGDSPGRSGFYLKFLADSGKEEQITQQLSYLIQDLERYWQNNGLREKINKERVVELEKENRQLNNLVSRIKQSHEKVQRDWAIDARNHKAIITSLLCVASTLRRK